MPIWLRTFTFNKLKEYYDKQQAEQEKQNNMLANKGDKEINRANVPSPTKPDYVTKTPKSR